MLFLAIKKLVKQYLASPILEGDNKGAKGSLIKVYTNVSIATDPLVSAIAIAIVKAIVKDVAKVIAKAIATSSTTANTSAKAKEEVKIEKDTPIKEQSYVLLKTGILLFIIAGTPLIIFVYLRQA